MIRLLFKFKNKIYAGRKKNYLGIDVSKLWFDVLLLVVINHGKQPLITARFDNTAPGMKAFKTWLKLQQVSYG